MNISKFAVTPERIRDCAALFDIALSGDDCARLAAQFSNRLDGLAALRAVCVEGIEPFVAFPVDRDAS